MLGTLRFAQPMLIWLNKKGQGKIPGPTGYYAVVITSLSDCTSPDPAGCTSP